MEASGGGPRDELPSRSDGALRQIDPAWALLVLAVLAILGGVLLQASGRVQAAHIAWAAVILAALVPLAWGIVRDLLQRRAGVDLIALLALVGALALDELLAGAIVGLMYATGQLLERSAQARARRELTALLERAPRFANRLDDGVPTTVPAEAIERGDQLLVREADVVPVDGYVLDAPATLDEAAVTGESRPVQRDPGQRVQSGTLNVGSPFRMQAAARASESTYAGIVRLVEDARRSRAPSTRLADRYAIAFVPFTLLLSGISWWATGDPVRALAVVVVATPCPLILAVPIAIVGGMSHLARRGVVVKGGAALEALGHAQFVYLDKTGTVTEGRPRVAGLHPYGTMDEEALLQLAASIAQTSSHILSVAIVDAARERGLALDLPEKPREQAGAGVGGRLHGRTVRVGRLDWVAHTGPEEEAFRRRLGRRLGSNVFVGIDGALVGAVMLEDPLRVETPLTLQALRGAGVEEIALLTGDRHGVAEAVGLALGIDRVHAQQRPEEKEVRVRQSRERGITLMVGDGINDAPALAAADVGVAMGARGGTVASEAADVVLTTERFDRLVDAIEIAAHTRAVAVQSAVLGMGLSVVAMGFAAAGLLLPVAGALLQEGIDVLSIASSLRTLSPGRSARRRLRRQRVLSPEDSRGLAEEHLRLGAWIERIRSAADQLDTLENHDRSRLLREVRTFLEREILAHEQQDERVLYPEIGRRLGNEDILMPMRHTHREIFLLARRFGGLVDELPDAGPDLEDLTEIRRLLYGLYAVLHLHFGQEEELYRGLGTT